MEPFLATLVLTIFLAGMLLRLTWIDATTLRLPDRYTLPLIALGIGLAVVLPDPTLAARLIGAVAGFVSLGLIGEIHFRRTGVEGLGLGDAKLLAAAGAWLGWQALPTVVLIAAVTGLCVAALRGAGRRHAPIAFGPMLAFGFFLCWIVQRFFPGTALFAWA